jgi:hypothetical protein
MEREGQMKKLIERLESMRLSEGSGSLEVDSSDQGIKLAKKIAGGNVPRGAEVIGMVTGPSSMSHEAIVRLNNGTYVTMAGSRMKSLSPSLLRTWRR